MLVMELFTIILIVSKIFNIEALNKTIRNTLIDFKLGCDQRKRLCLHHIFGFVEGFEFVIKFSFDKVVVGRYSNGCSGL